ncbi:MAG TPA: hypothetical protein VI756_10430 [Blastocatellia bacterium]
MSRRNYKEQAARVTAGSGLSVEQRVFQLLTYRSGAYERIDALEGAGATDLELHRWIVKELGPGMSETKAVCFDARALKAWVGRGIGQPKPTLQGRELLDICREVLQIPKRSVPWAKNSAA